MPNMKPSQQEKEDILSSYMDALNDEKKPNYEDIFGIDEEDEELLDMLQTVCAVKRLREDIEENKLDNLGSIEVPTIKQEKTAPKKKFLFKRILATAAMVVILLGAGITYENISNTKQARNVAYALIKQYNLIHNFKGVIQETMVNEDSVTTQKIEVQYVEPNKFYAVHHLGGSTTKKLYNGGDTLYEYDRSGKVTMRTVDEESLEFELLAYRTDKKVKEKVEALKNAKAVGEEVIAGRNTEVYQFSYDEKEINHKIWIDKELGIALKESFQDGKGFKIISEFVEFDNDIKIVLPTITEEDEQEAIDERLTEEQKEREKELENIKSEFKEGQSLEVQFSGLADSNSGEFKVGENYFVFGITEGLKGKFTNLKPGTKLNVVIGFEGWTTNPVVKEVK